MMVLSEGKEDDGNNGNLNLSFSLSEKNTGLLSALEGKGMASTTWISERGVKSNVSSGRWLQAEVGALSLSGGLGVGWSVGVPIG
jgi:hypothetical protein